MNDLEKRIEALEDGLIDLNRATKKQLELIDTISKTLMNITDILGGMVDEKTD